MEGCEYVTGWDCKVFKDRDSLSLTDLKKYEAVCGNCIDARDVLTKERFIDTFKVQRFV